MYFHGYVCIQTDTNIGRHAQQKEPVPGSRFSISAVGEINFHDAKGVILL